MSTQYIIKFSKLVNEFNDTTEDYDGFVELLPSNGFLAPVMNVRTCKNQNDSGNISLLNKFITSNFGDLNFDDEQQTCRLEYKDGYMNNLSYKSTIKFDSSSSSAYSEFKKTLEELVNTSHKTMYYTNGRVRYVGEVVTTEGKTTCNGKGTLYYNDHKNMIKYAGEFDDGYYDGSGTFYNNDGTISIKCNNISTGLPVMKGKLIMNFKGRQEVKEIVFSDLWNKFEMTTKQEKREFVVSDSFVNDVASTFIDKNDKSIRQLTFEESSVNDQNVELWKSMNRMHNTMFRNELDNMKRMNKMNNALKTFSLLLFANIVVTLFGIFMK